MNAKARPGAPAPPPQPGSPPLYGSAKDPYSPQRVADSHLDAGSKPPPHSAMYAPAKDSYSQQHAPAPGIGTGTGSAFAAPTARASPQGVGGGSPTLAATTFDDLDLDPSGAWSPVTAETPNPWGSSALQPSIYPRQAYLGAILTANSLTALWHKPGKKRSIRTTRSRPRRGSGPARDLRGHDRPWRTMGSPLKANSLMNPDLNSVTLTRPLPLDPNSRHDRDGEVSERHGKYY